MERGQGSVVFIFKPSQTLWEIIKPKQLNLQVYISSSFLQCRGKNRLFSGSFTFALLTLDFLNKCFICNPDFSLSEILFSIRESHSPSYWYVLGIISTMAALTGLKLPVTLSGVPRHSFSYLQWKKNKDFKRQSMKTLVKIILKAVSELAAPRGGHWRNWGRRNCRLEVSLG